MLGVGRLVVLAWTCEVVVQLYVPVRHMDDACTVDIRVSAPYQAKVTCPQQRVCDRLHGARIVEGWVSGSYGLVDDALGLLNVSKMTVYYLCRFHTVRLALI